MTKETDEIRQYLELEQTQLGAVYRALSSGIDKNAEIAVSANAANTGVVSNLRTILRLLLESEIPRSASLCTQSASKIRAMLKVGEFSYETSEYLRRLWETCDARSSDATAIETDEQAIHKSTVDFFDVIKERSGVYVYSFPMYLKHESKSDPDRFWLKVGKSDRSVWNRIKQGQGKSETHFPEDPVPLRLYAPRVEGVTPSDLEKEFHAVLNSLDVNAQGKLTGSEWYATTLKFLDQLAEILKVEVFRNEASESFPASGE
jgi:hypothetical protein